MTQRIDEREIAYCYLVYENTQDLQDRAIGWNRDDRIDTLSQNNHFLGPPHYAVDYVFAPLAFGGHDGGHEDRCNRVIFLCSQKRHWCGEVYD